MREEAGKQELKAGGASRMCVKNEVAVPHSHIYFPLKNRPDKVNDVDQSGGLGWFRILAGTLFYWSDQTKESL